MRRASPRPVGRASRWALARWFWLAAAWALAIFALPLAAAAQPGAISGTVTEAGNGSPLANIGVGVYTTSGVFVVGTSTNASGTYTVTALNPGTYVARTGVPTFQPQHINELYNELPCSATACDVTAGTPIPVTAGATTNGINFTLTPLGRITGTVTDEATGSPLADVLMVIWPAEGPGIGLSYPSTDATGFFRASGIPTGTYVVTAVPSQAYVREIYDNVPCVDQCVNSLGTPIAVVVGETVSNIDFALAAGASITGTVRDAGTSNPISGAGIQLYSESGSHLLTVSSNASGAYAISKLPAGSYFARAYTSGANYASEVYDNVPCDAVCVVTNGTPITVTAGTTRTGIDFSLGAGGRITGVVTAEATGLPLAGIQIQIRTPASPFTLKSVFTDASGAYVADGLDTGSYSAVASSGDYVVELWQDIPCVGFTCPLASATPISVTAGATTGGISFALTRLGHITGTVTNANTGAPITGMTVVVDTMGGAQAGHAVTNASGVYTVTRLPAGSYVVGPLAGGYVPPTPRQVAVVLDTTTSGVDFALVPAVPTHGGISGFVRDEVTGFGIGNVLVEVLNLDGTSVMARSTADGTGHEGPPGGYYEGISVPAGSYLLRTHPGWNYVGETFNNLPCVPSCSPTAGTPIVVGAGVGVSIDFSLVPAGRIVGQVSAAGSGAPLAGVMVNVHAPSGAVMRSAVTDAAGQYSAGSLPAGSYYLRTANTMGYKNEIYNDQPFCASNCRVTGGHAVAVVNHSSTVFIDFALTPGMELIQNGDFSAGLTHWGLFATPDLSYITWSVATGVFQFFRVPPPAGTSNQAVILQQTGAALPAGAPLLAEFDLSNTSTVRKRISVLVHDSDFSDLSACTFWLPPQSPSRRYGMRVHTTKPWTNATLALYAASPGTNGGAYEIDNVSLQSLPGSLVDRFECLDALAPAAPGGADSATLLVNGDFASGTVSPGWGTFGQIQTQVSGGVLEFVKLAGSPAGVLLQPTGQAANAGELLTASFELGNPSADRKRVTVILHDNNFSDLSVCTFWIPPGQVLSNYTYRTFATQPWANVTLSIYPSSGGTDWLQLDNVSLRRTPSAVITGTECVESGGG